MSQSELTAAKQSDIDNSKPVAGYYTDANYVWLYYDAGNDQLEATTSDATSLRWIKRTFENFSDFVCTPIPNKIVRETLRCDGFDINVTIDGDQVSIDKLGGSAIKLTKAQLAAVSKIVDQLAAQSS